MRILLYLVKALRPNSCALQEQCASYGRAQASFGDGGYRAPRLGEGWHDLLDEELERALLLLEPEATTGAVGEMIHAESLVPTGNVIRAGTTQRIE